MLLDYIEKLKKIKLYVFIPASIALIFILWLVFLLSSAKYYHGIMIDGIDISGMSKDGAKSILVEFNNTYRNEKILLNYGDKSWKLNLEDISLKYSYESALEQAYRIGREGNIFNRFYQIINLRFNKKSLISQPIYEQKKLVDYVFNIKGQIDSDKRDASISFKNGKVDVSHEVLGEVLDIDKNINLIENQIDRKDFQSINLIIEEDIPSIRYDDIKDITDVLSAFETYFNPKDINRTENIKLSCSSINGVIIFPNEVFSLNNALGPRTVENGYKEARVIYKNEYVNGIGGGVCQLTTTLYNVILKAKLKVVERSHHSIPSLYVEPGQDATIAEDYIDFKFQNNVDYPIAIIAQVVGDSIKIKILGKKGLNEFKVKLVPKVIEEYEPEGEDITIDNSLPDNQKLVVQEGKKGLRVILYRYTYDLSGQLIEKETISDDVYKPRKPQVKVNQNYYNLN